MKTTRHNNHGDAMNRTSLKTRFSAMASCAVAMAAMATFSTIGSVVAATDTWSTNASTGTFSTAANWGGTGVTSGDSLVFSNSSFIALNNDLTAGFNLGGFTFTSGASTFTISGNSINLSGGITNNSTALETIGTALALQNNLTITNSTTGTIALSGIISGNYGLTLSGGTVTLSGVNTFTGGSTLTAGTLNINNAAAVGTGALTVNAGATAVSSGLVFTNSVVVNGTETFNAGGGATFGNANTVVSGSGTLNMYNSASKILYVNATNFANFNGVMNFTVGSGGNTYLSSYYMPNGVLNMSIARQNGSGALNITVGALGGGAGISQSSANAALTFNITGTTNATFSGTFPGNNTRLYKSGAGTETLAGANTGWVTTNAAAISITNGAIAFSADNNLGASSVGITLAGGALNMISNAVTLTHAVTVGTSGTLNNTVGGVNDLIFGTANTLLGSGSLNVIGGPVWLQQTNSFSGSVSISNNGLLELGVANAIATNATVTVGSGGVLALDAVSSNAVTLNGGTLSPNNGPQTNAGSMTLGTSGGIVALKNWWNSAPQNLTLGGAIGGTGNLTVTASGGAATLTVSGNNTYSGDTVVNSGVLAYNGTNTSSAVKLASGSALMGGGSVGAVTINGGATVTPGTLGTALASLRVTGLVLNAGGNYNWLLQDSAGAAGTGYGTIASSGALDLSGLNSSTPFNINLWTISSATTNSGSAINFNYTATTNWTLVSYTGLTGTFDPSLFAINLGAANGTSGFANATNGVFSLAATNNSLQLVYTANSLPFDWTNGSGNLGSSSVVNNSKLNFAGSGGSVTNDILTSLKGITFGNIGTVASGSYTLSGNGVTLGSGGIVNFSAYSQTVALPLVLGSAQTFGAASNNLIVSGTINNGGNTLTLTGPFNTALNGVVSGSGGLTVSSGSALLSGVNAYTGATRVNGGTLTLASGGTMGASSSAVTISGGTVDLGGQTLANNNVTLNSGALNNGSADLSQLTLNNGSVGASLTGSGALAKGGSGTVTLNGNNSYSGGTTLNGGLLVMGSANALGTTGTISFNGGTLGYSAGNAADNSSRFSTADNQAYSVNDGGQAVRFGSDLTGAGSSFAKTGTGTVTLAGNNPLSGGITAGGGALAFAGTQNIGTGNVTLDGGALQYAGTTNLSTWSVTNGYTVATNVVTTTNLVTNSDLSVTTNVVTSTNVATNPVVATYNSFTNAVAVTSRGGGLSLLNGQLWQINATNQITGSGALTLSGNNNGATLVVNANQTNFTGPVTISGARLEQGGVLGSPTIAVNNGGELAINLNTTNAIALNGGTLTANNGARTVSGPVSLGASGGTVSLKNWWNATAENLTLSGVISGNGVLNVTGPGTLYLSGGTVNTYTGGTVVNAGSTVVPGYGNYSFGSGSVTLNGGTMSVGGISMNTALIIPAGVSGTVYNGVTAIPYNNFASVTGSGTLNFNTSAGAQMYVDGNYSGFNGTVAINGTYINAFLTPINGTNAAFVVNGAGLGFRSGTATASTTISLGSLSGTGSIGTKYAGQNVNVTSGYLGLNDLYSGNLAVNAGTFTKVGAGTMTLTGNNTYSGVTTVSNGVLALGNGGTNGMVSGAVAIGSTGTLALNRGDLNTNVNAISGTGVLAQTGAGTTVLYADNSAFTGTVKLNAGVLSLGQAGSIGTNAGIEFNGGTLQFGPANNNDYSAGISTKPNQQFNIDLNGANVAFANGLSSAGGSLNLTDLSGVAYTTNVIPVATNAVTTTNVLDNGDGTFTTNIDTNFVVVNTTNVNVVTNVGKGDLMIAGTNAYTGNTVLNQARLTLGNGGNAPSLAGNIANNGALAINNANSSTLSGDISGTGAVSKSGTGTVVLSGNNSFTGGVNLAGGAVALGSANAIGSSGVISFTGGALRYGSANQTDYSARFSTTDNQAYSVDNNGQNVTWGTPLTSVNGTLRKTGDGVLTLSAANTYGGATTLNGGGLTISGSLGAGTVTTAAGSTLKVAAGGFVGGDVVASGTVGGGGTVAGALVLNSGSSLNLSGGGSPAILSVSSLIVNGGSGFVWNLLSGTYDHLNVSGHAIFNATSGSPFNITVTTNALSAFNPMVNATYTIMNFGSSLNFDPTAIQTSASDELSGKGTWDVAATANTLSLVYTYAEHKYELTSASGVVLQSANTNAMTEATAIVTKTGAGEYVLDRTNSYGGNTTIASGTLTATSGSSFGNSKMILLGTSSNGGSNAAVAVNASGVTVTNTISAGGTGSNALVNSSTGNVTFSGGLLAGKNVTVENTSGGTSVLSGTVAGTGQVTYHAGNGVIVLNGNNIYTGGSLLDGGVVSAGNASAFGTGTVSVAGVSTLRAGSSLSLGNAVSLGNGSTGTVNAAGNSLALAGQLSGGGNLNVADSTGTGTVTLAVANSYTGTTTLNGGSLVLGTSSSLGNGALTVNSGTLDLVGNNASVSALFGSAPGMVTSSAGTGTLILNGSGNSVFNGVLSGSLAFNLGAGNLQLTGANSYSGGTVVNGGLLYLANGGTLGSGPVTLNAGAIDLGSQTMTVGNASLRGGSLSNGTLAASGFNVSGTPSIGATLADAAGASATFTLSGGTVTLGQHETYTGGTVVSNGALTLAGGDNTLATNGSVNLSASLLNVGGNSQVIAGLAGSGTVSNFVTLTLATPAGSANNSFSGSLNGGSLVIAGPGTAILSGSNALTGTATVNSGGNLELDGGAILPGTITVNGSLILNALSAAFTNALTGSGNLAVSGGNFNLNGSNGLTGGTVIGSATITPANNAVFGPGLLTLNNGAMINVNGVGVTNSVYVPSGSSATIYNSVSSIAYNKLGAVTGSGTLNFDVYVNNARAEYFDGNYANFAGTVNVTGHRQIRNGVNYDSNLNFLSTIHGENAAWNFTGPNTRYVSGGNGSLNVGSLSGSGSFSTGGAGVLSISAGYLNTDSTFSGDIYTGTGSFTKVGIGTLSLTGANLAYTGATTVNGGTLSVTGGLVGNGNGGALTVATNASYVITTTNAQAFAGLNGGGSFAKLGAGTVTVNGSGNNFSGTASVSEGSLVATTGLGANATVSVSTGANLIASGNIGSVTVADGATLGNAASTLSLTSLTFGGNAVATLLNGFGVPAINVAGALTTASGVGTVTLNVSSTVWDEGINNLITFGNSSATLSDFVLGTVGSLSSRQTTKAPELVLTANGLGLMVYGDTPVWTGAVNNTWSTAGGANWVLPSTGTATTYLATDKVIFNDTGAGNIAIDTNGVSPTRVTVSNNVNGYTFTGGSIGDNPGVATVLAKTGSGTLILSNAANTYTGGTVVNGGSLVLAGGTLGSSNAPITLNQGVIDLGTQTTTNGVVTLNGGILTNGAVSFGTFIYNDGTLAATLTGAGSLVKNGSGVLALNLTNTYSGGTVITGGAVSFTDSYNIGSGTVTLSGGSLQYAGNSNMTSWSVTNGYTVATNVTSTTNLVTNTDLSITTNVVTATNVVTNPVVVTTQSFTNHVTVGANGGGIAISNGDILRLNSANQLTGAGSLAVSGNTNGATLVLNAAQSYSGNITVNGARLELGGAVASPALTVNTGGELAVDLTTTNAVTLNGGVLSPNNANRTVSGSVTLGDAGGTVNTSDWWNATNARQLTLSGVVSGNGALNVTGPGTLVLTNSNNAYTGGTVVNTGSTVVPQAGSVSFGTGAVTLNGGTINMSGNGITNSLVIPNGVTGTIRNSSTTTAFNNFASVTGSGTLSVNPGQSNQVYLDGNYSAFNGTVLVGGTYINAFNYSINATNAAFVVNGAGLSFRNGTSTASADVQLGSLTGSSGIATKTNTQALNITSGYLGLNDLYSGNMNISAGTFTKVGAGTMTLAGTNNSTGSTVVNGGTLALASGGTLTGTNGAVVVNGGTLDLGGQSAPIAGFTANGGTVRNGTLNASSYTVTSGTIDAVLADGATSAGLSKTGTGTATLTTAPTYTGTTTITGGGKLVTTVQLPGAIAFTGAGKSSYLDYGDLGDTTITNSVTVSGGAIGNIQNGGSSTLTLSGTMDNTGSSLRFFGGAFKVTGQISNTSASNSSVSLVGSTVNLATAQSYGGSTAVIGGGNLVSGIDNALPSTTVLTLARNTDPVAYTNSFDLAGHLQTLAGLYSHGDGVNQLNQVINTSAGKAVLTLTGDSTYGGTIGANINVAVNGGSLLLSAQNQLAAGDNLALNNGTLNVADGSNVKVVGSLTLTGASVIDFSGLGGRSSVGFNSLTIDGTLSVYNWSEGITQLFDNSNGAGFAQADLSKISFYSGGIGSSLITGEIVAVPEPGVVVAGVMLLAFLLLGNRRTIVRMARRIA